MPRGGRGNITTLVGLAFVFSLAVCVIGFAWTVSARQATHTEQGRQYAKGYAESTESRIARTCTGAEPLSIRQCVAEQISASRESQRAEYDLSAQQSMADWAAVMAALTLATFIATAIGVWFVKRTLDTAFDTIREAQISNKVNSDNVRPWIGIRCTVTKLEIGAGALKLNYIVSFENYGQRSTRFQPFAKVVFASPKDFVHLLVQGVRDAFKGPAFGDGIIMPGEVVEDDLWGWHNIEGVPKSDDGTKIWPLIVISVFYLWEDRIERTDRSFAVGLASDDRLHEAIPNAVGALELADLATRSTSTANLARTVTST